MIYCLFIDYNTMVKEIELRKLYLGVESDDSSVDNFLSFFFIFFFLSFLFLNKEDMSKWSRDTALQYMVFVRSDTTL